ncbi:hypothetical protein Tco_0671091, partial [Tanacetum coccineum]
MQKYTRFDAQSLYDAMIFNMDSIGKYMLEITLHQQRTPKFCHTKTCSENEDPVIRGRIRNSVKESSWILQQMMYLNHNTRCQKAKYKILTYFRSLHSYLQVLSKEDLKGTRIEHGFKRAFMLLFGQDADTFTSIMHLNVDKLQKQHDKDEFQEDGSMAAFWVVNNQFYKFINSQFTLDYDSQMTDKYFVKYTGIKVKHFTDTLLQHMSNVKKSVAKRTRHQRQHNRRVNLRQMQRQVRKIDTGKALDNGLVVMKSNGTESEVQDESSRSGMVQMLVMQISDPFMMKSQWL